MSIKIIKGDLLKTNAQCICHQVNCQGKMGSGIAKKIKEKWPKAYDAYLKWYEDCENNALKYSTPEWEITPGEVMLGHIKIVKINSSQIVIHMAAQQFYGYDGELYTSYDAFWNCLKEIEKIIPKNYIISFPYKIGCVRGGANWTVIFAMIKEVLAQDYEVQIYKLEE